VMGRSHLHNPNVSQRVQEHLLYEAVYVG